MEESTTPTPGPSSGYAKHPLWHWIILYALIGAVVYAAIYYLFLAKNGPTPYTNTAAPAPEVFLPENTAPEAVVTTEEDGVSLTAAGFDPQTLNIKVGTKVIWANSSGAIGNVSSTPHPVHTDHPPLNLGSFPSGGSISLIFDKPGTYKYHNHLNPSQFGSIVVE